MREASYATFKQVDNIFSWCYIYYIFFTTFIDAKLPWIALDHMSLTNDSYNDYVSVPTN